jgi:hypothetical protein
VFLAIAFTAIVVAIGATVDASGQFRTMLYADSVAAEAARAGGQAIDLNQIHQGGPGVVDPTEATAAATTYLAEAGVDGTVTISTDRTSISVTVTHPYQTRILGLIGIDSVTVTGEATATLVAG